MDEVRKAGGPEVDPHVSVTQAGRELDRAPATIKTLALSGELETAVSAGRLVVTRKSLDAYKARHGVVNEEARTGAGQKSVAGAR